MLITTVAADAPTDMRAAAQRTPHTWVDVTTPARVAFIEARIASFRTLHGLPADYETAWVITGGFLTAALTHDDADACRRVPFSDIDVFVDSATNNLEVLEMDILTNNPSNTVATTLQDRTCNLQPIHERSTDYVHLKILMNGMPPVEVSCISKPILGLIEVFDLPFVRAFYHIGTRTLFATHACLHCISARQLPFVFSLNLPSIYIDPSYGLSGGREFYYDREHRIRDSCASRARLRVKKAELKGFRLYTLGDYDADGSQDRPNGLYPSTREILKASFAWMNALQARTPRSLSSDEQLESRMVSMMRFSYAPAPTLRAFCERYARAYWAVPLGADPKHYLVRFARGEQCLDTWDFEVKPSRWMDAHARLLLCARARTMSKHPTDVDALEHSSTGTVTGTDQSPIASIPVCATIVATPVLAWVVNCAPYYVLMAVIRTMC